MYENTNLKNYNIAEGCPWYEEQQSYGPPNLKWCEQTQCSIINEPANAWSNLGFLVAAIFIYQKVNQPKEKFFREFAGIIFIMGLFSFTYHATNNFFSQFFDFIGMYLMTSFALGFQVQRIRGRNPRMYYTNFWFFMFAQTCLFWFFHFWGIPIQMTILVATIGILIFELWARGREKKLTDMKYFWIGAIWLGLAQTASQMDIKKIYCVPENVFLHGHAVWHVLGAFGMAFLALHMKHVLKDYKQWT